METDSTGKPATSTQPTDRSAQIAVDERILQKEPRNLVALALYYVCLRVGWVFKTESVIMPTFLDQIAGAGWIRGFLPVFSRFGQSVPPLLFAERLRQTKRKKHALVLTSLLMAIPFLVLSRIWYSVWSSPPTWIPGVFLVCYFVFFCVIGLNQMSLGTLQGKLIRADRRGRLMSLSGIIGSVISILCAWFLLQYWLGLPNGSGFVYIFAFTGCGFVVAGLVLAAVSEPADHHAENKRGHKNYFREAWRVYRDDRAFRRVATVGMCFSGVMLLFPHFQALASQRFLVESNAGFHRMTWVVAQNAAVGLCSYLSGTMADRFGNRIVIRFQVFISAMTPVIALILANLGVEIGQRYYWITFCLLGLAPVTLRTLVNYTLELVPQERHPRYVSTLSVCLAIPFCLSPAVGWLLDQVGFTPVFIGASVLLFAGGILTFAMSEPRNTPSVIAESEGPFVE